MKISQLLSDFHAAATSLGWPGVHMDPPCLFIGAALGLLFGIIGYYVGKDRAFKDIKLQIIPICRVSEFGAFFWRATTVKYGYQYQLFVKGIPSLKSEEIIIAEKEVKEVDQNQLQDLIRQAVRAALATETGGINLVLDAVLDRLLAKTKLMPKDGSKS
jgi:hypothetical protein